METDPPKEEPAKADDKMETDPAKPAEEAAAPANATDPATEKKVWFHFEKNGGFIFLDICKMYFSSQPTKMDFGIMWREEVVGIYMISLFRCAKNFFTIPLPYLRKGLYMGWKEKGGRVSFILSPPSLYNNDFLGAQDGAKEEGGQQDDRPGRLKQGSRQSQVRSLTDIFCKKKAFPWLK